MIIYYSEFERALQDDLDQSSTSIVKLLVDLANMEGYLSDLPLGYSDMKSQSMAPLRAILLKLADIHRGDENAQLAVVSCLCLLTKYTSDEYDPPFRVSCGTPYERMEDVFEVIVSSIANLGDTSSGSYAKRVSILEFLVDFKSFFVMMLDCRCNRLIATMFENFLDSVREDTPEKVVSSMKTIMNFVLEVCVYIPMELLLPLLVKVKKGNDEQVSVVACELAESVLQSCDSEKVQGPLLLAVNSLGSSLDDYSEVVSLKAAGDRKLCRTGVKSERHTKKAKDGDFVREV